MARFDYATNSGIRVNLIAVFIFFLFCLFLVGGLVVAGSGFISIGQGDFVILVKKTGRDLTNDMLLAPTEDYKGTQLEVLREGYHWRNPYMWSRGQEQPATVIPDLKVGVVTRRFGNPLGLHPQPTTVPQTQPGANVFGIQPSDVIAYHDDEKGILPEVLLPGRHYMNTAAYSVQVVDMVKIDPGFAGIVVQLVGQQAVNPNAFVVREGERGTQPFLLGPGTHPKYSNPWMYRVVKIDTRSRKLEMAGDLAIKFPSKDGFEIVTEGTIEWAPIPDRLPEMFVIFCEESSEDTASLKQVDEKVLLPLGRSFLRIQGAMHKAVDFVAGSTKIQVQQQVETLLREECERNGIQLRSFVINSTEPPRKIRMQYERRELARRQKEQFESEIIEEVGIQAMDGGTPRLDSDGRPVVIEGVTLVDGGTPKLDDYGQPIFVGGRLGKELQTRQKDRATKIGEVRGTIVTGIRKAEQDATVLVIGAEQALDVAKLKKEAAVDNAATNIAIGTADADIVHKMNEAEAAGVEAKVKAFESGDEYARNLLLAKIAPSINSILSNTDGPFADLVTGMLTPQVARHKASDTSVDKDRNSKVTGGNP